jgi:hypothetical protein
MVFSNKIIIVYFIYLRKGIWKNIFLEQFNSLKLCGLYDTADQIYVSLIFEGDELIEFENLINDKFPKIKIKYSSQDNNFEFKGFKTIYEIASENNIILYFHSKGIFSGDKNKENNWLRKILFKYTIENYKEYLELFEEKNDLDIGLMYPDINGSTWYNFFWVKGSYIVKNKQKPEINTNRFYWEHWIVDKSKEFTSYSPIFHSNKISSRDEIYEKNKELKLKHPNL